MNNKHNNKGIALFISLSLLFLLSIGAIVVLLTAYNYANITENQIKRSRAITLAESGINYAYWKIRIGQDDDNNDVDFGDGNPHTLNPPISIPNGWIIEVVVQDASMSGRKTIQSTVTY